MKTKTMKLVLKKETIATLNDRQMKDIEGGVFTDTEYGTPCSADINSIAGFCYTQEPCGN